MLLVLAIASAAPAVAGDACISPPQGLVAWWPGNGNANDVVGTNDGTTRNGTTFAEGEVGQAFDFDGEDDDVLVPASASLDVGTGPGFTLELWVNPTTNAAREPLFEWNRQSGSPNWGAHLWIATTNLDELPHAGNVYANLVDTGGGNHVMFSGDGFMVGGAFQHVAFTYDKASGAARYYRNGTLIAEASLGTFTPQTSYDLFFAARPGPVQPTHFDGLLDEIALYDRALSLEEIQDVHEAAEAGKCLCGDASGDTEVKAGDALFVLQSAVGTATCNLCICDVNGSGSITALDSLMTLKLAVGLALATACPDCIAD
ncbi:MAG TPA: LamG-like jellyroll fold domain-containing protein [Candidatus Binatia bacterium]|nr:LamG-like jellyroll fold domain-containing protein [Candidatus Binatia bacterium]